MKNYVVKAVRNFDDVEEKNEMGGNTPRFANISVWNCTKERYEYLKNHNAVILMGIDEIKEEPKVNISKETIEEGNKIISDGLKEMIFGENILKEKPKKATKKASKKTFEEFKNMNK